MNARSSLTWLTFAVLAASTQACSSDGELAGNGVLVHDARTVEAFHGVAASENLVVEVTVGPQAIDLEMDDNLVGRVATFVRGGVLFVEPQAEGPELKPSARSRIRVTVPSLDHVEVTGAAQILATTAAPAIAVEASASGRAEVSGTSTNIAITTSGSADVVSRIPAAVAEISSTASSTVQARATSRVQVTAIDSAFVRVGGSPPVRELVQLDAALIQIVE